MVLQMSGSGAGTAASREGVVGEKKVSSSTGRTTRK